MGLFRVRDKFNIKADGYWMKGKCFLPGKRLALRDDSAVFTDTGVIVKNRKGKRNPLKTNANVDIAYTFFGPISGRLREIGTAGHQCRNEKVCHHRNFRIRLEQDITGGIDIAGMRVRIVGWKGDRGTPTASEETEIMCEVGSVI